MKKKRGFGEFGERVKMGFDWIIGDLRVQRVFCFASIDGGGGKVEARSTFFKLDLWPIF